MKNIQKKKSFSFYISDELWDIVDPLIPNRKRDGRRKFLRKSGGGRKPIEARQIFAGIVYVLKTGCQWKAVPKEYGSSSSIHSYFMKWEKLGFFDRLWRKGAHLYDELEGIAWKWQALDGSHLKAPISNESNGKSPVDRGKKWNKKTSSDRRKWYPTIHYDHRRK
jgi:transposase